MSTERFAKREVDCLCVVRPQEIGRAVVKIEGKGETREEGETGFKECDLRCGWGCVCHLR